ncbi:MAG: HlyD family efflux transporter periplasmic adaptor subunit [Alphaproteobacteria bacterium]|nr:HlyD family efflux transporter periplasmic adaptor subunit [Alphaproteobacteria bacterium]
MFRKEVIARRVPGLSGDVFIAVPISWQAIGFLMVCGLFAAITFLSFATYSKTQTAFGSITSDKGIAVVYPTRQGTIEALSVENGSKVADGVVIANITVEESSASGASADARIAEAIDRQDANLLAQIAANQSAVASQVRQNAAQSAGLQAEISQLLSQISLQRELIVSAEEDFDLANEIATRGFVSARDLQLREDLLLQRQQGLAQLTQALAAKRAALSALERSAPEVAAQADSQNAALAALRAQVAQQAARTDGARSYAISAPVAGRVTSLTAKVGQIVSPQSPMLSIIPDGSKMQAQLTVPNAAISFVRPGQTVRLAIDAFPYQRYGTLTGRIRTVSESPITVTGATGAPTSVYLIDVALDRQNISVYGREEPLIPGMTLSAQIVTQKQSLIEWLFEPLFAVVGR